jgi:hypothetical protein
VGAVDADPLKVIVWLILPVYGPPGFATGNAEIVTVAVAEPVPPDVSVTVKVAV